VPFTFLPGVGLLILSTVNRFHNVNTLIRARVRERPWGHVTRAEMRVLFRRAGLFHWALTSLYAAMALFSVAALIGNLQQGWAWAEALGPGPSDALITAGVVCVVFCAVALMAESALSHRMVRLYERCARLAEPEKLSTPPQGP
jgi:hypothetical protein